MNKLRLLFVLFVFIARCAVAQIPYGYYIDAQNKNGEALKEALYGIIKGHTEKTYGDARYILDEADADLENDKNVLTIYSAHSVSGTWDAGETWNREHVWAKSRGFGDVDNSTRGTGSDLHNLRACISKINTDRNNRWFAESDAPYKFDGVETGSFISTTDWFWEPRNDDKGDVARIIFYMATRYEGENGEPDLEAIDYIPDNNFTNEPVFALLSELLQWHIDDSVSEFERHRNEVIYSYQKNRNPFIDHPKFVDLIWGDHTSTNSSKLQNISIYPNPAKDYVFIDSKVPPTKFIVYNIIGSKVKEQDASKSVYIGDLENGQYFLNMTWQGTQTTMPLLVQH